MIKKILLIIITIFITNYGKANFRDYYTFPHKVNTQALRDKKLGYSDKLNIFNPNLKDLFNLLNKRMILSPIKINNIILTLNHTLKKQNRNAFKNDLSFLEKNGEKNLGLNSFDINKLFIVPNFGINQNQFIFFLDSIASKGIIDENLKINSKFKFIFIENFFEYVKNNNLQSFVVIAMLKILNPENVFIIENKLENEITSNKIARTDLPYFIKYKRLYKKIENKKMNTQNPQIVKMEIQNFYTYRCTYLNEEEKTRFIIARNLNQTIKQMVNVLTFLSDKIDFYISYNKKNSPKNISLNKKRNVLLKKKNFLWKKFKFNECPKNKTKIEETLIYKISPTTLNLIKENILCIYKINSDFEIEKIKV